jgi:purine-binding chemotaxis protein CheW
MNLADIRKKAEESKRSAAVSAEVPEDSATVPDMAAADSLVFEGASQNTSELPLEVLQEEMRGGDDEPVASRAPLPEPVAALFEQQPEPAADIERAPDIVQSVLSVAVAPAKSLSGYNALATILAGRELAAAAEENSSLQTLAYTADEVEEYLCFRVAHEWYAISILAIKEIVKPRDVTAVPRVPTFILGVISLRGVIIPVMDMRLRLSLPLNPPTGRERIIVLKMETGFCGVLVDEVIQVARIQKSCIEEPPSVLDGIDREFVTGLGYFDSRMLIILNLATILDVGVH